MQLIYMERSSMEWKNENLYSHFVDMNHWNWNAYLGSEMRYRKYTMPMGVKTQDYESPVY